MARKFKLEKGPLTLYTVFSDAKKCVVDLKARTCICNWFQTMELPCEHAIIAIVDVSLDPCGCCAEYYSKDIYIQRRLGTYRGKMRLGPRVAHQW
ncbi:hypothetical protein FRX31_034882 [Thalictrum thalictroides]|uniref:SWIM-type domain-containing protein n=1 Tax=Thalictrum thalictroides TaxID=46969 RepID=A0A7J6USM1_THATH|nr:hypothetical protein FRX31_034882 [Thalictrum thalictroides]